MIEDGPQHFCEIMEINKVRELNAKEVDVVAGASVSGVGQAMAAGGAILLGVAALPIVAPVAGTIAMFGAAWGIGGALIWGKSEMLERKTSV
ncbi:hypothetical protein [Massilia sp. DD77]|uniref:hypothetical protein n=1 Tax=Massilia sp. DD77 TaxID=3109349 RepID=UPI002FFFDB9C